MGGRDFKWVVGLLLLVATAAYWQQSRPTPTEVQPLRIELTLSPNADFRPQFQLSVIGKDPGAQWSATGKDTHSGLLSRAEFQKFEQDLVAKGLWTLDSAKESAPEESVLYTRLVVSQGGQSHRTQWRGLPTPAHRDLALVFLRGPVGKEVDQGLQAMLALKGQPEHKPDRIINCP